ncbi:MAG: ATP-binding cassette domain-containing protein [Acidobacteria bacterium]|nr:ATP-binding cassette domain-containing protein [Acidobacteriota bacterium]
MLFKLLIAVIFLVYIAILATMMARRIWHHGRSEPTRPAHPEFDRKEEEVLLELRHVYKSFGDVVVLSDVNLRIRRGESLGVLGKSGSGKSVLLKLLVGLLKPDQGEVLFKGKSLNELDESELLEIRKRVSYVFQGGAFFDFLDVKENIAYPLRERGITDETKIEQRVSYLLEAVEMEGLGDLEYDKLSLGLKKQVAIARAIANDPEIILYDEPTTGVDPIIGKSLSRLIRKLNDQEHLTAVVVTHDLKCLEIVSDRIILLKDGIIYFEGDQEAFHSSRDPFVKAFIAGTRFEEVPRPAA